MPSEEFKEKVAELQEKWKENITDKELYSLIEKIVKQDPITKKWIEE